MLQKLSENSEPNLLLLILTSYVIPQGSLLSGEEGTVWISKSKTKPHQDEDSWFWFHL